MKCVSCNENSEYIFQGFSFCKKHKIEKEKYAEKMFQLSKHLNKMDDISNDLINKTILGGDLK